MISGKLLSQAIISGANHIFNQKNAVDEFNVFPVPDGDTGTNMSMTISAGKSALETASKTTMPERWRNCAASSLLRGASGNSGVILSLLFRGLPKGSKGKKMRGRDFAEALSLGCRMPIRRS